jgi:hypothetical protein
MAKRVPHPFPGTEPKTARKPGARRASGSPATFIQRSRQVSSEQKAIWHNVTGAGRRGVLRKFFDLNDADKQALRDGLEKAVALRTGARQRG